MIIEGLSLRPMNQCVGSFRNQFQYFEPSLVKTKTLTPSSRIETDWKTWSRRLSIGLAHFRSQTYFAIKKRSHARNYSASAKSVSHPTIVLFPVGMEIEESEWILPIQWMSNRKTQIEDLEQKCPLERVNEADLPVREIRACSFSHTITYTPCTTQSRTISHLDQRRYREIFKAHRVQSNSWIKLNEIPLESNAGELTSRLVHKLRE